MLVLIIIKTIIEISIVLYFYNSKQKEVLIYKTPPRDNKGRFVKWKN